MLKSKALLGVILLIVLCAAAWAEDFQLIDNWKLQNPIYGWAFPSLTDQHGNIIGAFFKVGIIIIDREKRTDFARPGEGPGDLMDFMGICEYQGNVAVLEHAGRIKVFTFKTGKYEWKENVWLKQGSYMQRVNNLLFFNGKWFLAGHKTLAFDKNKMERTVAFLAVHERDGKHMKDLIATTDKKGHFRQYFLMNFYIVGEGKNLFFLAENELTAHVLSADGLSIQRAIKLETPPFYKPVPKEFYDEKDYNKEPPDQFDIDSETWKTGYSRITQAVADSGYLVVQVRTGDKKLKKFALLCYDAGTLKLKKTVFINDMLLNARLGKYYFIKNGDPSLDEEADEETVINCYTWKK